MPDASPLRRYAVSYRCAVVTVKYRRTFDAPYPAAINDLHAGYQWMVENAEMLRIDPDKVVLFGPSSGAHLATAFPFRLMRYGFPTPRGVVAVVPQTDDRPGNGIANTLYDGSWDASTQHSELMQWMGPNFACSAIGPEALANHATIEDCVGYPPLFIHTGEWDPDRDNCREFYHKVLEAKSFAEFHCWGGADHVALVTEGVEYYDRIGPLLDLHINECFKYDMRRPWVVEESK